MLQDLLRAPVAQEMAAMPGPIAVSPSETGLEDGSRPWLVVRLFRALKAYVAWHLRYYKMIARDARTPRTPKILLWCAVLYAVSPIGLVPDIIPVVGYLDDVIIVPTLIMIAVKRVPPEIIIDCRLVMGIRRGLATAGSC
jgi:uncharacterized membrane protein YkvA (DUF1232 family)